MKKMEKINEENLVLKEENKRLKTEIKVKDCELIFAKDEIEELKK